MHITQCVTHTAGPSRNLNLCLICRYFPVEPGSWHPWGEWSQCSCDQGSRWRNRVCASSACGGDSKDCLGDPVEAEVCKTSDCQGVSCMYLVFAIHKTIVFSHPTTRIPNSSPSVRAARPSQKPSHGNISGTKCGIIDPLVSKRQQKILNKKN